jgi:ParB-like chromosome segregation protein Spo0J
VNIRLSEIVFDAGTQIRAALDEALVSDYAEQMTNGDKFPPVILFHDGNRYYLADGFHRFMAAQRNQWREIDAEVRAGAQEDALWFALGANRSNGKRLTVQDKQHAVAIALRIWPAKMQREIAAQVGCSESLVSKVASHIASNTGVDTDIRGQALVNKTKRDAVREMVESGAQSIEIRRKLKAHTTVIAEVRREVGAQGLDKSRDAVKARRDRARQMASEGHTSRQIAAELGLSERGCKWVLSEAGIDVPADKATRGTHRHDSNRIVDRMTMDAENLTADTNLIDFSALDRERIGGWIDILIASRKSLDAFIRQLIKEKQKHGEAA